MSKEVGFGLLTQHQEKGCEVIRLAKLAEDLGYGTYWVPEDPYYRGSFVTAATIAAHTTKIRINTSVINPFLRHPVAIAQEWSALDEFSEGRAMLGISSGAPVWLRDQLNLPWRKPLTAVRETIDIFERLVAGEAITYDGELFQISNPESPFKAIPSVKLSIPPYRSKIPVHLGAQGPKFMQLCGERCDGFIMGLSASVSETALSYINENLRIGAERNGRDASNLDISLLMTLSISENDQEARDRIKPFVAAMQIEMFDYGDPDRYPDLCLPKSYLKELSEYAKKGGNAADLITDDVLDDYVIAGSPERCKERIARLVDAGINSFVLVDYANYGEKYGGVTFDVEPSMKIFAEKVMPAFL